MHPSSQNTFRKTRRLLQYLDIDESAKEALSTIPVESQVELLEELTEDYSRVRNHSAFIVSNVKRVKDGTYRSRAPKDNGDGYSHNDFREYDSRRDHDRHYDYTSYQEEAEVANSPQDSFAWSALDEKACTELPSAASLHELSEKVVQLTKAVVFLYTRSDGHEVRRTLSEAAAEEELKQLTTAELRNRISAAEGRATCDEQWLIRQIAAETHRERRELEKRFEEEGRQMKAQHAELMEQLRGEKDDREMRAELSERRRAAELEADEALAEAVQRQELSFEAERQNLENAAERNGAALVEAREESARAKDQCEDSSLERQRVLDEMSRELQERKRQGQTLSKEADVAHQRKLRHENDGRELRRKKDCKDPFNQTLPNAQALLERGLGNPAVPYAEAPETTNCDASERAVVTLSEDRPCPIPELRSDEMQRLLLRLEQGI
eukprot:s187_g9.t1